VRTAFAAAAHSRPGLPTWPGADGVVLNGPGRGAVRAWRSGSGARVALATSAHQQRPRCCGVRACASAPSAVVASSCTASQGANGAAAPGGGGPGGLLPGTHNFQLPGVDCRTSPSQCLSPSPRPPRRLQLLFSRCQLSASSQQPGARHCFMYNESLEPGAHRSTTHRRKDLTP
jgi:hypothetical protein